MAREYLCDAGECETRSEKLPILVTSHNGSRERFCSYQHLAEWAAAQVRAYREEPIPSAYSKITHR